MRCSQHIGITTRSQCIPSCATTGVNCAVKLSQSPSSSSAMTSSTITMQCTSSLLLHLTNLVNTRGRSVERVVQSTDGCASQFKSRGPFADISCALQDFGCTMERNFFGSRHGKGPSDGESAVVKHHAATAIKSGTAIIGDAKDLFDYCFSSKLNKQPSDTECTHFRRSFFWIPTDDISRYKQRTVKTLKGTRALHSVRCVEQHVVLTRQLSCSCPACSRGVAEASSQARLNCWPPGRP